MPTRLVGASASQTSHFICMSENGESGSINFKSRICLFLENHMTCYNAELSFYQFSTVTQSCPILFDPMDCSMPDFPVHHHLSELAQTHGHRVGDASQPSHPLSSPSPPAFNLLQHQGIFQGVSSSHQVAKVLELQLQH